jgi:hypothetical protein
MDTLRKLLPVFLVTACLLALTAWLVHEPKWVQADEIPEKYRDTVSKGLDYLAGKQHKDGHWEGDDGKHPVAMTGLVGLALLMEQDTEFVNGIGEMPADRKYSVNIHKAVDWLIEKSQVGRGGLIYSEHASETSRYMEGHGLATIFLAGICRHDEQPGMGPKKLNEVLTRAVKYIVNAQSTQGGWYHTSKVEGHDLDAFSTTVIQIQALQAAENAGIPVPSETINDAKEYLKKAMGKYVEGAKPVGRSRQTDTASALTCCFNDEGRHVMDDLGGRWLKYCQTELPVGRDMQIGRDDLTHYYFAQAVFHQGGDTWTKYRTATFDHLKSSQNKDGSWPASEGMSVGPVYASALWCTILQLDKKNHPSRKRLKVFVE